LRSTAAFDGAISAGPWAPAAATAELASGERLASMEVGCGIYCSPRHWVPFSMNSVSASHVTLISSKSNVNLLMERDPVGQSTSRSVGFSRWTADWSNVVRYRVFDTRPDTEFKERRLPGRYCSPRHRVPFS
jgi:hypothetical protein